MLEDRVEQSVKFIEQPDHLERCAHRWQGCKAHNITEVNSNGIKALSFYWLSPFQGFYDRPTKKKISCQQLSRKS